MKRLRILLLPIMDIAELALAATAGGFAVFGYDARAEKIMQWALRTLPNPEWYLGIEAKQTERKG